MTITANLLSVHRAAQQRVPLDTNGDDFVFDNQVLAETAWLGFRIDEVSCPASYAPDPSSINFRRSVRYGFSCLATAITFQLAKLESVREKRSGCPAACGGGE